MRVYAPRTTDATEATVLTPAVGAPHTDEFKVATISGVSGYQPYMMDAPAGRRGRIDLRSRRLDIGTLTVTLLDKRTSASSNVSRWVTAFYGTLAGHPPSRLRVEIDECLDYLAASPTWTTYFVGEIVRQGLNRKLEWEITVRERSEALKAKCFVGTPHPDITYAAIPTLLPVGFRGSGYGTFDPAPALTGTTRYVRWLSTDYAPVGEIAVFLDNASVAHDLNVLTQNLIETVAPHGAVLSLEHESASTLAWTPNVTGKCRCRLTAGATTGVFRVGGVFYKLQWPGVAGKPEFRVVGFYIKQLDSADVDYMAAPSAATSVSFHLYAEEEVSPARPLLIDDVDPVTFLEDLCAGKFGTLYRYPMQLGTGASYGNVTRAIATNTASFDAVRGTRPTMRTIVTESASMIDWVEKNILIPYHLALYLNKSGEVCLVDLKMPTSTSGLGTLTDTDVVEEEDVAWEHDPTQAVLRVDITRYSERKIAAAELRAQTDIPRLQTAIIEERAFPMESIFIGSIDYGDDVLRVDARGYRSMEGELVGSQSRSSYMDDSLIELATEIQRPFGYGLSTIPLTCRRTSTVTALNPGSLVIVDVDVVPDPGTWVRGGPQLCRVVEYSEDGPTINLRLAFLSSTSAVGAPTLAAPAQETGNTFTGVTCAVTLHAGGYPVVVRYAVTETSVGTVPADDSTLWRHARVNSGRSWIRSSQTVVIRGLPPGKRVWVQGRSYPVNDVMRLPSAWANAAAPGYVDTAALATPSSLAATVSDKTCLLTWTNGASDLQTQVLLATPTSDPRTVVRSLPPGTTRVTLENLTVSTQYRAEVRHILEQHPGAGDTEDFTTTASATTAPDLKAFYVVGAT